MDFLKGQNIKIHARIRVLLITAGIFAISTFNCLAEDKSIFGLNFEVESLNESSPDVTEFRILGITKMVPKSELDRSIVDLFFDPTNAERTKVRVDGIPLNRLEQFTIQAAEAESSDIAAHGLYAMGLHNDSSLESMRASLDKVKPTSKSREILKTAAPFVEQTKKMISPLFAISVANCETTANSNYQLPQNHELNTRLYYYAAAETTRLLIDQHTEKARNILTCMKTTFNSKELNIINIDRLSERLPGAIAEFEKTREYKFPNISELASGDNELEEVLTNSLSFYLLSKSKKFIDENDPGYALWLISRMPETKRTIETLELTQKSLSKLEENSEKAILIPGVSKYLFDISQANTMFRAQYIKFLVQLSDKILKQEKPERLQVILGLLTALNPDPNETNDTVRLNLASYYVKRGAKDMGLAVYAGLKGGLPLKKKIPVLLTITWLKYPITCIITLASLLGFLVLLLVYLVKSSQAVVNISRLHLRESGSSDDSLKYSKEFSERPLFVKKVLGQQLTPTAQEYSSLVSLFEIEPDSTVRDIKHAYREKMKVLHPDMKMPSERGSEAQEIMKTRKAYERLLEIRNKNLISDEELSVLKKRNEIRST